MRWLTTEEKARAKAVLVQDHTHLMEENRAKFTWSSTFGVLKSPHTWALLIIGFTGGEDEHCMLIPL